MQVKVNFYSYCKDLTGCAETTETLADGSPLGALSTLEAIKLELASLLPARDKADQTAVDPATR